jgi:hypothetical protein
MTTLFITDNPLKLERAISVSEKSFCPAREDGIPTIEYSEATIKLLVHHKLNFVLDIPVGTAPPTVVPMFPHPENSILGTNWYVPAYWQPEVAFYDVEYKHNGDYKYKNQIQLSKLVEGLEKGFKVTRIYSEKGLTPAFLERFDLRLITKGKFRYAVPKKKK